MTSDTPTAETLREHDLPDGALAVTEHWAHGVRSSVTVPADDRDLYRLLKSVLDDASIPETMPADLAVECDDLVEVHEAVSNPDRGNAIIDGTGYGLGYCHQVRDAVDDHRDREPMTLAAVGCSGSKYEDDGTMPASERYKGSYWSGKRRYYRHVADEGRIISAKHGLLHPQEEIEHYDATPDDLEGIPIDSDKRLPSGDAVSTLLDSWALDVCESLQQWIDDEASGVDPRDVELEILLGTDYRDELESRGVFDALRGPGDLSVSHPFQAEEEAQGGMMNQIGWMNSEADAVAATDGGQP